MKSRIIGVLIIFIFLTTIKNLSAGNFYSEKTVEIDISRNMICEMSITLMKKALKKVKGVQSIEIDRTNQLAIIIYEDSETNPEKLEDAFIDEGFYANNKAASIIGYESLPKCCKRK